MSTRLCNKAKVCDIYSLGKLSLVGRIKNGVQGDMPEHLVDTELMRIKHHGCDG